MRVPERLEPLLDQGVIDEVVRPLMSGKEAQVYLVMARGQPAVAKVYKDSNNRSFHNRADYTEGRRVRNTREQRAMEKRSRYGREQTEAAWRSAEVDAIYRLRAAGVAVPEPFDFIDGVLVMEMICDESGEPALRLADISLEPEDAHDLFHVLLREVVKMLCAGVVHGDLSDFNVLMGEHGPIIIDFPQVVDPSQNRNARKLLLRDVQNLQDFLGRFSEDLREQRFGPEMWDLYESGKLTPETPLTGRHRASTKRVDTWGLLAEIEELERENRARREALGLGPARPARKPMERAPEPPPPPPPAPAAARPGRGQKDARRDQPRQNEPRQNEPRQNERRQNDPRQNEPRQQEFRRDQPRQNEPRRDDFRREEPRRDDFRREEPRRDDFRREEPRRDEPRRNRGPDPRPPQEPRAVAAPQAASPDGAASPDVAARRRRRRRGPRGGGGGGGSSEG